MAGMFTVQGDPNFRHNIPGRPVFDPAMSVAFLIGLGLSLLRKNTFYLGLLGLAWLIIFMVPSYLTEAAPHFLRTTGILSILFIYPALGLEAIRESLGHSWGRLAGLAVASGLLLASLQTTFHDYFLSNFLASPEVFVNFDGRESALILHTNQLLNAGWTVDNIFAKPLVTPPFNIWIQPDLWPDALDTHTFAAAAQPNQYPYFKTLTSDSVLTAPFALLLDPIHQAEWLSKLPPGISLTVETVSAGNRLFSIYRTPELNDRPYTYTDHGYQRLDAAVSKNVNLLAVEYPLQVTPGNAFDLTVHLIGPDTPTNISTGLRFDVIAPDGSIASESTKVFDLPLQKSFTDLTFPQSIYLATPPGVYTLKVSLFDKDTFKEEPFMDAQGNSLGNTVTVGTFRVLRPSEPPTLAQLQIGNEDEFSFGPMTLLNYHFDRNSARPGEDVFLTLFFRANENIASDLSFNLFTPYLPTSQWKAGEILRFVVPVRIPANALGQDQFPLQLNQFPDKVLSLKPINITSVAGSFVLPTIKNPLTDVEFGKMIALSGYTLTTNSQDWTLNLVWHALNTPALDLVGFIHIEDDNGQLVAQSDTIPANGTRPTTGWLPGEYIVDTRHFAPLPPGHYTIFAGLYDPITGQRLDDRIKIGTYTAS
jgi:hypothetical protein